MILAMFVMLLWGINFTVIKFGVNEMSPMLLVAFRYIFTALPAIAFVKRPDIRWKYIITYGMTVGVGQFSCLFYAEHIGMPAGIASVVLQSQAFFTIIFASMLFKERIKISQALGLLVAGIGLFFISGNIGIHDTPVIPIGAFFLTLAAAFFWGVSNIIIMYASKEAATLGKSLNMFGMVVWSSLIPPLPMLLISFALDKPKVVWHEITNIHALALF